MTLWNPTTLKTNGGAALGGSIILTPATQSGSVILIGEANQRVFRPVLPLLTTGVFTTIDSTAYFVYSGFYPSGTIFKYVACFVSVAGTGVATSEIGVFTSPIAPNKGNQTLTRVEATATMGAIVGVGAGNTVVRNTSAFTTALTADSHVWGGLRTSTTLNEPQFAGVVDDWGEGAVLTTTSAGALTSGTFAGVVPGAPAAVTTGEGPYLKLEMD